MVSICAGHEDFNVALAVQPSRNQAFALILVCLLADVLECYTVCHDLHFSAGVCRKNVSQLLSLKGCPMSCKLSELITSFRRWSDAKLRKSTASHYGYFHARFLAAVGDVDVQSLKTVDLLNWGKTWHEIQTVQRLFNWGYHDAALLESNPFAKVKKPHRSQRRRILSRSDMLRLLRKSKPVFRRFLLAMRETIARPQEIRSLQWEDLQLTGSFTDADDALQAGRACFVLWDYKCRELRRDADTPRLIPISRRLGRLLLRLKSRLTNASGPIFLNLYGKPWSNNASRLRMRRLRNALGWMPDRRGESVVCYSLRHTSATFAASLGIRDRTLADLMGHTNTKTTSRYLHLTTEHLQQALDQIQAKGHKPRLPAC
jgi:integrase